jgi:hypothetical protein
LRTLIRRMLHSPMCSLGRDWKTDLPSTIGNCAVPEPLREALEYRVLYES